MKDIHNPTQATVQNLPKKRKLTKYEEVISRSLLANEIYFKYSGENCDIGTIMKEIVSKEDFDGYSVFGKFMTSAIYEKKNNPDMDFLPTDLAKEVDINAEKKFFTMGITNSDGENADKVSTAETSE